MTIKSKGDSSKVSFIMANMALESGKDRGSLYSECVRLSFQSTGRLSCGFDNKDLQAWIDKNASELFDEKGKRIR
jgi:hypothetical protein